MNMLPPEHMPDDAELETRLRAHFDEHFVLEYGEPLPAATVLERIEPRLHSPATRIQAAVEGVTDALRERARGVLTHAAGRQEEVVASPSRSSSPTSTTRRRIVTALAPIAAVLVVVGLAAVLVIPRLLQPAFPVPSNWHDVTPPTPEAIANYAVSPDVPGLILACIGSRAGSLSASPMGPAHVWRTHDGGANWEQLPGPVFTAGCQIASVRGAPATFFISDGFASTPALWVTHDQGSAWAQVPMSDLEAGDLPASAPVSLTFQLLAEGVYRNGALYSAGIPNLTGTAPTSRSSFALTRDDGRTWAPLEATPDPNISQGYMVAGIAADYRASSAWFRLLASDSTPQSSSAATPDALLEHSDDNGQTWTVVGRIKAAGAVPESTLRLLATTPSQPERVCVALNVVTFSPQSASLQSATRVGNRAAPLGPPPPLPSHVSLYGSDDGGVTWHGGTVTQYSVAYGGPVQRGVQIDAAGNCFLATTDIRFTCSDATTIWQLAPRASAAQPALQLPGVILGYFALGLDPDGSSVRLVAMAAKAGPLVEVTCHDPDPCVEPPPMAPHLIWTDAP